MGRLAPAITSTPGRSIMEMARLDGRAAEHVGQQDDAVAGIHALDTVADIDAALFDVVIGLDADGGDALLGADHMLHGGTQFLGQPAVGHQNHANHETRQASCACVGIISPTLLLSSTPVVPTPAAGASCPRACFRPGQFPVIDHDAPRWHALGGELVQPRRQQLHGMDAAVASTGCNR